MILTLEVTGPQARELGAGARKVFKAIGGTIGRLPDNDWVFPDPYVSGRHALIRYVNDKYFVEDTSTNGVFINSPDNRLKRGQPQQLHDGDLLFIDAYQINVSIQADPDAPAQHDQFASLKAGTTRLMRPPAARAPAPTPAPQEDRTANLALLRTSESHSGPAIHEATVRIDRVTDEEDSDEHETEWFGGAEMIDARRNLPPARSRPELVKATVAVPAPRRRTPPPVFKAVVNSSAGARPPVAGDAQAPAGDAHMHMKELLDAAGIEGLEPSAAVARTLGEILRIALGGVMEALRTRERMKDDLRMRGTSFKASDNNPLKFSANVDDAFHNLLVKHNPAYLPPTDAFEEAFRDVRDHQAAFQSAMRLAFESMLAQFDPQRLQEEFDRQMKGSILGVPAKLRYWDLYRDKYGELVKDAEAGFRSLFVDAFAQAYEEHLARLRSSGRPAGQ
jgi:type VI secretion system protein ImpI